MALRPNSFVTVYTNTLQLCYVKSDVIEQCVFSKSVRYIPLVTLLFCVFVTYIRTRSKLSIDEKYEMFSKYYLPINIMPICFILRQLWHLLIIILLKSLCPFNIIKKLHDLTIYNGRPKHSCPLKTPGCRAGAGLLHARPQGGALYSSVAVVFCNLEIDIQYNLPRRCL